MKRLFVIITIGLMTFHSFAKVEDVKPLKIKLGDKYIRITKINNERVSFEHCLYGYESTTCSCIGNQDSYSFTSLKKQFLIQKLLVGRAIIADIVLTIPLLLGVGFFVDGSVILVSSLGIETAAGAFAAASGSPWVFGGFLATLGTVLSSGSALLMYYIKACNFFTQLKEAYSIRPKVFNDEDVYSKNIEKDIQRLELVLSSIE